MAIDVIMPKAGMDMQEGQIFKWHKQVGEYVQKGEVLLEIVTDKVNMEVEAEESGYLLKILREEGETVPVITTIAYLGEQGEQIEVVEGCGKSGASGESEADEELSDAHSEQAKKDALQSAQTSQTGAQMLSDKEKTDDFGVRATPKARKYAKEEKIDLLEVVGTQENGRIGYQDVVDYDRTRISLSPVAKSFAQYEKMEIPQGIVGSGVGGKVMKSDLLDWREKSSDVRGEEQGDVDFARSNAKGAVGDLVGRAHAPRKTEAQKMNNMRAVIAKRMKQSYLESPVVHYNIRANMKEIQEFIEKNKKLLKETYEVKVSINDFIMLALARTLIRHPALNCKIDEENSQIIYHNYVDLAMAVGLDDGLLTPVIRNAQDLGLVEMAISSRQMSKKARDGKINSEELANSTFTVSNLGMYGVESFTPIINQPNTAIMGVGTMIKTPFVNDDDEIEIAPFIEFSLSADHRVCDGVVAAKFMRDFKNVLENPVLLLV